jgi:hypothetical protein
MFRNVLLIDVVFAYSLLYPIDEVLAKFSYVRLAFQLNKAPEPIDEAALQVPAQPRLTDVHQPRRLFRFVTTHKITKMTAALSHATNELFRREWSLTNSVSARRKMIRAPRPIIANAMTRAVMMSSRPAIVRGTLRIKAIADQLPVL